MKKFKYVIIVAIMGCLIVGYYFYLAGNNTSSGVEDTQVTELSRLANKDIEKNYPETPRAVVDLYSKYLKCVYNEDYSEDEFDKLTEKMRILMDTELLDNNPKEQYLKDLQAEISEYKNDNKRIANYTLDNSNDVKYYEQDGVEYASLMASYFINVNNSASKKAYEDFVLRKDGEGYWKIFGYTGITNSASDEND